MQSGSPTPPAKLKFSIMPTQVIFLSSPLSWTSPYPGDSWLLKGVKTSMSGLRNSPMSIPSKAMR